MDSEDRAAESIVPEDKDWTFVIESGCAQCGFTPEFDPAATGDRLRTAARRWLPVLARADARNRPNPGVWSPVEYGCHVRDTCRIFRGRLELMRTLENPEFANWDQDVTAVADRYAEQDPGMVAGQLVAEAEATAEAFDAVSGSDWERPGRRSNGSVFTIRTFAVYFLHDVEHHLHDVAG